MVLAFPWGGWVPTIWAAVCVAGQVVFQAAMSWSPLATTESARPEGRQTFYTDPLNYEHFTALRSNYWRSTTADALMIGRAAYGYVVWQKSSPPPQLHPLLSWRSGSTEQSEAANILALLRSGTVGQATTFVVFRKKPGDGWTDHADQVTELDLDPNRLAPMESIASVVDVFVGVSRDRMLTMGMHPIVKVLKAAGHKLIVLDAQLPVPAPVAGYEDRRWARVRVALRDAEDIRRLVPFLSAVSSSAVAAPREYRLAVAVRTVSSRRAAAHQQARSGARWHAPERAAGARRRPGRCQHRRAQGRGARRANLAGHHDLRGCLERHRERHRAGRCADAAAPASGRTDLRPAARNGGRGHPGARAAGRAGARYRPGPISKRSSGTGSPVPSCACS